MGVSEVDPTVATSVSEWTSVARSIHSLTLVATGKGPQWVLTSWIRVESSRDAVAAVYDRRSEFGPKLSMTLNKCQTPAGDPGGVFRGSRCKPAPAIRQRLTPIKCHRPGMRVGGHRPPLQVSRVAGWQRRLAAVDVRSGGGTPLPLCVRSGTASRSARSRKRLRYDGRILSKREMHPEPGPRAVFELLGGR